MPCSTNPRFLVPVWCVACAGLATPADALAAAIRARFHRAPTP